MEGEGDCCLTADLFEVFPGEDGVCYGYVCALCGFLCVLLTRCRQGWNERLDERSSDGFCS